MGDPVGKPEVGHVASHLGELCHEVSKVASFWSLLSHVYKSSLAMPAILFCQQDLHGEQAEQDCGRQQGSNSLRINVVKMCYKFYVVISKHPKQLAFCVNFTFQ